MRRKNKKITLKEFFESDKELAIHCDTEEKANLLLKAFDKMGKTWTGGDSYLDKNLWGGYKEETCYENDGTYCDKGFYLNKNCKVYEFEEIILDDKMQTIILSDDELKIINDALGKQKKEIENTLKKINELQKKLEMK